jgi:hypothetical protein
MKFIFLQASVPLTKTFSKKGSELVKTPYPFVWEFTSIEENIGSLGDLCTALRAHAAVGHCLLKGEIKRPLIKESRAGSTDTNSPTEWAVLDLDGLPEQHAGSTLTIDLFLQALGLGDISYIVQWSASYGLQNKKIRAHIFFLLDRGYAAPLLKQWLVHLNHSVDLLRSTMSLTKTGNAISWPLDISACQNDKLIYIAPPVLKGVKDPLTTDKRIALVKRKHERLSITAKFSSERNRELTDKRLDELREAEGLSKKKTKTKMHGSVEVLKNPDQCTITEMKSERGFVYFNLNGGDSWAYYHPETNPEFILNFKGEPTYLTKELLPDYWSEVCSQTVRTGSDGTTYLAFCDRKTAAYFIGTYSAKDDVLDLNPAKTPTQVRDFAKQVGMPLGDAIPYWDLVFDPHSTQRVDFQAKTINLFSPSEYMKAKPSGKVVTQVPKTILRVITHALGGPDDKLLNHFLNWCAFIIQRRAQTKTAWVLHGVPGTGKGILCTNILRPLLGAQHTTMRRMEELNEIYNQYMRNSFLVVVDEVQTSALQNEQGAMAKIRNFITEPMITIRAMYANAPEVPNFTNWIFNSNMPDPVMIPKNDRRMNVGKYQTQPLQITTKEVEEQIPKELQTFYEYLMQFPLDEVAARTFIDTADRTTMIHISEASIDTVADKLLGGAFDFFMDQLPAGINYLTDNISLNRLANYKHTLAELIKRTDPATGKCNISREEVRVIFDFVIGGMPNTPNKFTSLLKHHRVHIEKVWLDNHTVSGLKLVWTDLQNFPGWLKTLNPGVKSVAPPPKLAAAGGKKV